MIGPAVAEGIEMGDLSTRYLGLDLRTPLVASASPLGATLDGLRHLEDAGAAAVVMPSLFEEQIEQESREFERVMATGAEGYLEASGYFPQLDDYNTGPDAYLKLVEQAKGTLAIPLIASLNGTTLGGWVKYATLLEEAGADALELNVYLIAADPDVTSEAIEARHVELVEAVEEAIDIPLAVKIGPYFSALANMAWLLIEAGADGLVLFNRFYLPDIDPERLEVTPHLVLSTSDELRLTLRWIAILRGKIPGSLAATTGIHIVEDAVKVLLAGADVAMLASALLRNGPEHLGRLEQELAEWLVEHDYRSVEEMRGAMSQASTPDPDAFERANYMRTLTSYTSPTVS